MTEPLGLDALRERLREYDPSLPRCKQRITRAQNCAPDFVPEEERAEWDMVTYVPCCRPEGHEGKCRSTRLVLGFPGYDTLTALLDEVHELRTVLAECVGADLSRADAERAKIVAWLRAEDYPCCRQCNGQIADCIERGDHYEQKETA